MLEMKVNSGFNLLELLVTLTIVGILAAIGVPSFNVLIENQRIRSASNDLIASLNFARSEAITKNTAVTMTQVTGGWVNGWTVSAAGGTVQNADGFGGVAVTASTTTFQYNSDGRTTSAVTVSLVPSSGNSGRAKCVTVSLSGKPTSESGEC